MPVALDRPSGMFEMKMPATATALTAPPGQQRQPDDDRLRDAVQQRAGGDDRAAPPDARHLLA
jgi:hypothetical protein